MSSSYITILILLMIFFILTSLGAGLYYLVKDQGKTKRTARSLLLRIILSFILFIGLMIAFMMGWLRPHSLIPSSQAVREKAPPEGRMRENL